MSRKDSAGRAGGIKEDVNAALGMLDRVLTSPYYRLMPVYRLRNPVRNYAWGSKDFIPAMLGLKNRDQSPWAELWAGAHPASPSEVELEDSMVSLDDFISADPASLLGPECVKRFNGKLPFLLKILSAEKPLSIQTHPDKEQALRGFEKENSRGLPADSPERSYKDAFWKPELLYALTPFYALAGFRRAEEIVSFLSAYESPAAVNLVSILNRDKEDLSLAYRVLLELKGGEKEAFLREGAERALKPSSEEEYWLGLLLKEYPEDPLVFAPFFMNLLILKPGETVFLGPGIPHAYLHGTGVEIMANSDNVLRGGLTEKYVNKEELFSVLRFIPNIPEIKTGCPGPGGERERIFPVPVEEFVLSRLRIDREVFKCPSEKGLSLFICISGLLSVSVPGSVSVKEQSLNLFPGDSFLLPADTEYCLIGGRGVLFRASVPGVGKNSEQRGGLL